MGLNKVNIMKRSIILFVTVGALFLVGAFVYNLLHPAETLIRQEAGVLDEQQAVETELPLRMQVAGPSRISTARAALDQGIASATSVFRQFEDDQIVDESVRALGADTFSRKRLVRVAGKHPNQLFKETVHRNTTGNYEVVSQVGMVADQVTVKLTATATEQDLSELATSYGASVVQQLPLPRYYILQLPDSAIGAVDNAMNFFGQADAVIALAEPNHLYFQTRIPDDPEWPLWGMQKIQAPDAWDLETGDPSILVAVIDGGVDFTHEDLAGNKWVNPGEAGVLATNGLDDDANGYIDDWQGWDFYDDDNSPETDEHGTHVAGTIGAMGDNNRGVVGVCWDVGLVSVQIFSGDSAAADSDIVRAILYASSLGARVQNNSWGAYGDSTGVKEAIETINSNNVLFVAAAGNFNNDNDSNPFYPASHDVPNIVSVAATDESDRLASFSHYGATSVDLAAPGVNILSTIPGDSYELLDGTSMASPHVAGAAALLWSTNPSLTHLDVKAALLNSVDKISALTGKMVSGGRLNVSTLMAAAADEDADGMPDDWELEHFGTTTGGDPDADPDNDHLTNLNEYFNGTDPLVADTDGDSLVDGWEVTYGFSPLSPTGQLESVDRIGVSTDDEAMDVVVVGGYAYIADGEGGLVVIDVSPPEASFRVATLDTVGFASGIAVSNGIACVADGTNGLVVVDVSNPSFPQELAVYDTPGEAVRVVIQGSYAYVADSLGGVYGGLEIVDISNPNVPVLAGRYNANNVRVTDVYVSGNSAFLTTANSSVLRIDVLDVTTPKWKATKSIGAATSRNVFSVHGNGTYVFVASDDQTISVFDMNLNWVSSNPGFSTADEPDNVLPRDVYTVGNFLYVAEGEGGLEVFDISDINNPVQFTHYPTYGGGKGVFADGNYIYLADGESGLQIFGVTFDEDADGMLDSWEEEFFGSTTNSPTDDADGDGIINRGEYLDGLDPTNPDQDADGLIDGDDEVVIYNTDPRESDTDQDGLVDGYDGEVSNNVYAITYPGIVFADTNANGFVDGELDSATDPLNPDTDGDGMNDGWEVEYGLDPLVPDADNDPDGDGLTNVEEFDAGTDPNNPDTDGDDMPDGWEVDNGLNPLVDDSLSDPDNDGLFNLYEYSLGYSLTNSLISNSVWSVLYTNVPGAPVSFWFSTNGVPGSTDPNLPDSDGDGLEDLFEITTNGTDNLFITNPNNADTDGDGLSDGWEFENYDVGPPERNNPTVPADDGEDSDGDGLTNGEEEDLGTDRTNSADPIFVDEDAPGDEAPGSALGSDPDEDGTITHPFDAIQKGIASAVDGLTVLVLPGDYIGEGNYDIDPQGKAITVRSWNDTTNTLIRAWNTNTTTVINSKGAGATFLISSGETTNTVIKGFSLTTTLNSCSDGDCDQEEAVVITGASPLIQDCFIYECELAAIVCVSNAAPVIENCEITQTRWGIQAVDSTPLIISNRIYNIGNGESGEAGVGIQTFNSSGLLIQDTIVFNCLSRGLVVEGDPDAQIIGSIFEYNTGGITLDNSGALLERCVIRGNEAPTYYTDENGAWVATHLVDLTATGLDDTVDENENGGGILLLRGASPTIRNCLIVENTTWADDPNPYMAYNNQTEVYELIQDYGLGAGVYIGTGCNPTGVNCTVANNHANTRGGGLTSLGTPFFLNTIFWDNTANDALIEEGSRTNRFQFPNIHCRSGNIQIWYSDIEYGYEGASLSLSEDPLFIGSGDYHLSSSNSPCYEAGLSSSNYLLPTNDLDGDPRIDNLDIGCYEVGAEDIADSDGDGLGNLQESILGTDPNDPDTDDDGMPDGWEVTNGLDPLVYDPLVDSDGDLLDNLYEYCLGYSLTNNLISNSVWSLVYTNVPGAPPSFVFGVPGFTDPNDADSDDDGLSDYFEITTNLTGNIHVTNPNDPDTDGDGMPDGWEVDNGLDPTVDDALGDPDNDGVSNLDEYLAGTNPQAAPDTDGDGLPDYFEIITNAADSNFYITDPLDPDTDDDSMPDGWEVFNGLNPINGLDGALDADGDGLLNSNEYVYGCNPTNSDTDADGMPDGWEVTNGLDPLVDDSLSDPDNDGLFNLYEYSLGYSLTNSLISNSVWSAVYTNVPGTVQVFSYTDTASNLVFYIPGSTDPNVLDSDSDGLSDFFEITTNGTNNLFITNPNDTDTDGDGLPDGWEIDNSSDPTTGAVDSDDSDGDGLTNGEEKDLGTDLANSSDPVFVDDNGPGDWGVGIPELSDPLEDGTINHPFDAIQEGVNAVASGATVLVLPGEYISTGNYDVDPMGKPITIRSWNDRDGTVINSKGIGSTFLITNGETTNTVIKGFSLTTTLNCCSDGDCDQEDGVVIIGSSPVIQDCRIYECELTAIVCVSNAAPVIENCEIEDTQWGIDAVDSSPVIVSNYIHTIGNGQGGDAGVGIQVSGSSGLIVQDTVVSNCTGRGLVVVNDPLAEITGSTFIDNRGGITLDNSGSRIENCVIQGNQAPTYYTTEAGGWVTTSLVDYSISGLTDIVDENENGGGILLLRGSSPLIRTCLIVENTTWADDPDPQYNDDNELIQNYGLGGGIYIGTECSPTGVNCTVADNHSNTRGGGISSSGNPYFVNMIFWDNTANDAVIEDQERENRYQFPNIHCRSGNIFILTSDIEFGYDGAANSTTGDPLFIGGGDYHLSTTNSAAYDRGIPYLTSTRDLDDNLRPTDTWLDMGCYEYFAGDGDDDDNDGLTNVEEASLGTDPDNPDTDGDGMPDGWEIEFGLNPLVNDAAGDPDGDGLFNLYEYSLGYSLTNSLISNSVWSVLYTNVPGAVPTFTYTNATSNLVVYLPGLTDPQDPDSDDDGLNDFFEITTNGTDNVFITNPNNPDTDGDGLVDGWEVNQVSSSPVFPALPTDDSDGDDLTNEEEEALGTDPANSQDPVFVDDDAPGDLWPGDPQSSDSLEDGSMAHPFDAIQEAVNFATNGMTILVTNGLYSGIGNYDIDPQGKAIVIRSLNGPAVTTVNSLGAGPVFTLSNSENTNTVISGFSISVTLSTCSDGDCDYEHGIVLDGASPWIENCIVYDCELDGIHCENGSRPVILDTTVSQTRNGIWCDSGSVPTIRNCTVEDIFGHPVELGGRGIYISSGSGFEISDTTVSNCYSRAAWIESSLNGTIQRSKFLNSHGGITLKSSSPDIDSCEVVGNSAPTYYSVGDFIGVLDALYPFGLDDYEDITNEDENGAGILMSGSSSPFLVNCLIADNVTWADDPDYFDTKLVPDFGLGGGLYIGSGCSPTAINCTVADNHANTRGGGLSSHESPFLRNMIFWGNTSLDSMIIEEERYTSTSSLYRNLHCRSGNIDIWYSDIEFGYPTAQLSSTSDPLFVGDGDYHFASTNSAAYDIGTFYLAPTNDLDGQIRPIDLSEGRVDAGCYEFVDIDSDGMSDQWELDNGLNVGVDDSALDPDGDGRSNLQEYMGVAPYLTTDPNDVDSDDDGLVDGTNGVVSITVYTNTYPGVIFADVDSDGFVDGEMDYGTDPNNPDTDGDGLSDSLEVTIGTDPLDSDHDGDGMPDGWERTYGLDPLIDDADGDLDNDGLKNLFEYEHSNTDPGNNDTDGDGLFDKWEVNNYLDPNNTNGVDGATGDPDNDLLVNSEEQFYGTDPWDADTDDDGFTDKEEIDAGTDPLDPDSDGDGMPNGWEIDNDLDPELNDGAADADSDGLSNLNEYLNGTDPQDPDTDDDGLLDGAEIDEGTDPLDLDSDDDGMPDGWEVDNPNLDPLIQDASGDPDGDTLTNLLEYALGTDPFSDDTDVDNMPDGWEFTYLSVLNPADGLDGVLDADGDGLLNSNEYLYGCNPTNSDTDADGMPDGWEFIYMPSLNPTNGLDGALDADGDGILNSNEYFYGSNPTNSDTDADGMPDGWEALYSPPLSLINALDAAFDPDSDGLVNSNEYAEGTDPTNADSDGDGMPDGWEVQYGLSPTNSTGLDGAAGHRDSDTLTNLEEYFAGTNPNVADTDGDGIDDDVEVGNGTDPTNEHDPVYVDDFGPGDVGEVGNPDMSDPLEDGTAGHPFDSIQEAIDTNTTTSGMTIIVMDGVYKGTGNTDITLGGKELRIISENGSGSTTNLTLGYGPAFIIDSGQTTNTLIRGFTIETAGDLSPEEGVVVDGTSPILEDLIIHNCELEAVSCLNGAAPQIKNCVFYDVPMGLKAVNTSGLLLQECLIYDVEGRGIYIQGDDNAEVTWSTVSNCWGGITLSSSDAEIRQCIIRNNNAPNYYTYEGIPFSGLVVFDLNNTNSVLVDTTSSDENGAGILLLNGSSPLLQNCLIVENQTWAEDPNYSERAIAPGFGLGAGIYIPNGCNPIGVNCTVADNIAHTRGGGIASAGRPVFRNMIIWGNSSSNATITEVIDIIEVVTTNLNPVATTNITGTVTTNIVVEISTNNTINVTASRVTSSVASYHNLHLMGQVIDIWYSNVENGYPSNEVLPVNGDPLLDSDYTLMTNSPCIDSGTYYLAVAVDLAKHLRPTNGLIDRIDLGCYEYGATGPVTNYIALGSEIIQRMPVADPLADTDGDGFTDGVELAMQTDPLSVADYFQITHDQSLQGGTALIAWQSVSGCFYTVQFTDSLLGEWADVSDPEWINKPGDGSIMIFDDTRDAGTRFYRVLVLIP